MMKMFYYGPDSGDIDDLIPARNNEIDFTSAHGGKRPEPYQEGSRSFFIFGENPCLLPPSAVYWEYNFHPQGEKGAFHGTSALPAPGFGRYLGAVL